MAGRYRVGWCGSGHCGGWVSVSTEGVGEAEGNNICVLIKDFRFGLPACVLATYMYVSVSLHILCEIRHTIIENSMN